MNVFAVQGFALNRKNHKMSPFPRATRGKGDGKLALSVVEGLGAAIMQINGWVRTSLIDYPGHIATVLFTGGCNFRCPMCHNAGLVLSPDPSARFSEEEVFAFLQKRAGKLTGVVLSGGEPTLQPDLADFIRRVRASGYAVKLDTNGYRPDVLGVLLEHELLDYVAMDIKAPPAKYPLLSGVPDVDVHRIARSITLLCQHEVACEFRTTVVPGMLDEDDVASLARWLASLCGGRATGLIYVLQQFRATHTLAPALGECTPYSPERLRDMRARAQCWLPTVKVRGG